MNLEHLKDLDQTYIAHTYGRSDLEIMRGEGERCFDSQGRNYLDFSSGIGANSLGFVNEAWRNAVKNQVDQLAHTSNLYYTQPQVVLAQALCQRTGMKRVFFANSGAEANEGAIKTARKYSSDRYSAQRCEIITLTNSFHGRTITTLAATGQDVFHKNFGPFPDGFVYANANDIADLTSKVTSRTCAIFIECIQGEGGVIPLEQSFVDAIVEICQKEDILLMVDEVQTGAGRTGTFLCCEQFGISPDVVSMAKGLGGGLPIGAVLFSEKTADVLGKGDHGTTFGGNPIVCAGAKVVMDTLDSEFLSQVVEKGEYLRQQLSKLPGVEQVSGMGLMRGIQIDRRLSSADIVAQSIQEGLILLTAKDRLRMLPPLTITQEEINQGIAILKGVLEKNLALLTTNTEA